MLLLERNERGFFGMGLGLAKALAELHCCGWILNVVAYM